MTWRQSALDVHEALRSLRCDGDGYHSIQVLKDATGYSQPTISTALIDLRAAGRVEAGTEPDGRLHRFRASSCEPLTNPTDDTCSTCGGDRGNRHAVCADCLPFDPAGLYEMSELGDCIPDCIEMKVRLYTERYAAGLAMSPEPYTSPVPSPGGANSERSYDDRHIPR